MEVRKFLICDMAIAHCPLSIPYCPGSRGTAMPSMATPIISGAKYMEN
jgi:hypothetical protein